MTTSPGPFDRVRFAPVAEAVGAGADAVLVTQRELVPVVQRHVPGCQARRFEVSSLDIDALEELARRATGARRTIGFGGGTALDAAKYVAWKAATPLALVPSVLSVDAPFTREIAARFGGELRYVGSVVPDQIVIDTELVRSAPAALNRGGVGDLLSIHTALHDWRLAHDRHGAAYDADVAAQSLALLARLTAGATHVRAVSESGIRLMVELFCAEVGLCERFGSARPEEGSEHHILYNLEHRLGRTLVHGPAVTLTTLVAAHLQEDGPERVAALARACGVDWSLAALGVAADPVIAAIVTSPEYAAITGLFPTFLTGTEISESRARAALAWALDRMG